MELRDMHIYIIVPRDTYAYSMGLWNTYKYRIEPRDTHTYIIVPWDTYVYSIGPRDTHTAWSYFPVHELCCQLCLVMYV